MGTKIVSWALSVQGLNPREKLFLVCLAECAKNTDPRCWPGQSLIQYRTGLSPYHQRRALRTLQIMGLVSVRSRYPSASAGRLTNCYHLAVYESPPSMLKTGGVYVKNEGGSILKNGGVEMVHSLLYEPEDIEPEYKQQEQSSCEEENMKVTEILSLREPITHSDDDLLSQYAVGGKLTAAKAGRLFQALRAKYHPGPTRPPLTGREMGQLSQFSMKLGVRAGRAMMVALRDWGAFRALSESREGGKCTSSPTTGSLLRYAVVALDMASAPEVESLPVCKSAVPLTKQLNTSKMGAEKGQSITLSDLRIDDD